MSNEIIIITAKNIKLMGVCILACERRRISGRLLSPPAKVTFWISDKTLFFPFLHYQMTAHIPPQALRISHRGERETRETRASDWRRIAMDHGKDEEARRSDFSSVFSFPPSQRPYIVVSCKLISFSRWLKGIRNQSPQSVGTSRCSTSDWGQERHEICYERYFC